MKPSAGSDRIVGSKRRWIRPDRQVPRVTMRRRTVGWAVRAAALGAGVVMALGFASSALADDGAGTAAPATGDPTPSATLATAPAAATDSAGDASSAPAGQAASPTLGSGATSSPAASTGEPLSGAPAAATGSTAGSDTSTPASTGSTGGGASAASTSDQGAQTGGAASAAASGVPSAAGATAATALPDPPPTATDAVSTQPLPNRPDAPSAATADAPTAGRGPGVDPGQGTRVGGRPDLAAAPAPQAPTALQVAGARQGSPDAAPLPGPSAPPASPTARSSARPAPPHPRLSLTSAVVPARAPPPAPAQVAARIDAERGLAAPLGARPDAPSVTSPDGPGPSLNAPLTAHLSASHVLQVLAGYFIPTDSGGGGHLALALQIGLLAVASLLLLPRDVLRRLVDLPPGITVGYRAVALRPG